MAPFDDTAANKTHHCAESAAMAAQAGWGRAALARLPTMVPWRLSVPTIIKDDPEGSGMRVSAHAGLFPGPFNLFFDPVIGDLQTFFQRLGRFPPQLFMDKAVVRISPSHPLGAGDMLLR